MIPSNTIFPNAISLERAQELLLEQANALETPEDLPLLETLGRVAYDSVDAAIDQPPFDRSPLDGYALRHEDTLDASGATPAMCRVVLRVSAGDVPPRPILPGEAARVATGAMIPAGADCVIAQEDTEDTEGAAEGESGVLVYRRLSPFENYCFAGEDCRRGDRLVERGERLQYAHIGVLAGQGIERARVFSRLRVGVLTTGDELVERGFLSRFFSRFLSPAPPGRIYDGNAALISARLLSLGMLPAAAHSRDDPEAIAEKAGALLASCGAVVATGGVSVGAKDCMPEAIEILNARTLFRRVRIKPGSFMLGAVKNSVPIVCLSGNPFAAAATFEVLARPLLEKLAGNASYMPRRQTGVLRTAFAKSSAVRRLLRARIEGRDVFIPQKNSAADFARCNCLIDVPEGSFPLERGDEVSVIL
ncbi:MAG: molybdopterin molybdotransferase MoeA [Synergistaceae bacterium]|jgi:molybdopterin molybdotransferase|nr:molybdopterin molybdotransferase MoeA [Synergistaceae bacterium]